jgi:hypothetical protein
MKKKIVIIVIIMLLIMLIPIPTQLKNGNKEYKAILYKYTKIHQPSNTSATGYEDGWELKILGIHVGGEINTYVSTETLKPNLFDRSEIIKVAIDNYSQYKNNFEYTDKDTIDKIYNLFKDLKTNVASKSDEPENPEELYKVTFFNSENMLIESDNDIFKAIVYVYKRDNKYYVEEPQNGIYEVTEETFNNIKNYAK